MPQPTEGIRLRTIVVLFTRDLRVEDNPALSQACQHADTVVPLYVLDPAETPPPNRLRFLTESLADLRESLRGLGGDLLIRRGDPVTETIAVAKAAGATGLAIADDFDRQALRLRSRLARACDTERIKLRTFNSVTVLAPGQLRPSSGGDHYKVFTPYWRAWTKSDWPSRFSVPRRVRLPDNVVGDNPATVIGPVADTSPSVVPGGESAGLDRWHDWLDRDVDYSAIHDDLAADDTTRLSPYLHFGCVSPLAVAADERAPESLVRQLCWRDFYHQILAAFPQLDVDNFRSGAADDWVDDQPGLDAWRAGETGVRLVDAGMRQLLAEGWMHNRARMVTASYLTRTMGVDWRLGAAWFDRWLVDADVANNHGNWQWTAGTGTDTNPFRRFNPQRQAERFDPDGKYVGRYLAG